MAQTPIIVSWNDTQQHSHSESLQVHGDPTADPDAPVVILLHGTNGTIDDMSNPATHPGWAYDHATPVPSPMPRGVHSYPGIGVWGWALDNPLPPPQGWQPFLDANGFLTLNYQQTQPAGTLVGPSSTQTADPVTELDAVVRSTIAAFPGRRIAFVTHSRGGILLRAWLVAHGHDTAISPHLSRAVMLHAPNQGSDIANIAVQINAEVSTLESVVGALPPLQWLSDQTNSPAYPDYEVGSPFLATLAKSEPVPGIAIDTFGGTSPALTRLHEWVFTVDSLVPTFHVSGFSVTVTFTWSTSDDPVFGIRTLANDVSAGVPELSAGQGDVLVTDKSARLPFSTHHSHPVNHAEALWDTAVHNDGLTVLKAARGAPAVTADDCWLTLSNLPARVNPSTAFTVDVTVANTGTTVLDHTCSFLVDDGHGHATWGSAATPLSTSISRGHSATLSLSLTSPAANGAHGLQVRLQRSSPIGHPANASLTVQTQAGLCQQLASQLQQEQEAYDLALDQEGEKDSRGHPAFPSAAAHAATAKAAIARIKQQQAANGCP